MARLFAAPASSRTPPADKRPEAGRGEPSRGGLSRGMLLFESLPLLVGVGLLGVALAALLVGGIFEFVLRPGTGWTALSFASEHHAGLVDLADVNGDGRLDRLVSVEPRVSEPPSFKIISSTPEESRPNQQLYLMGKIQLPQMQCVTLADGRRRLLALSASQDSTLIYLNLFAADSGGAYHRAWSGPLFGLKEHPHNWKHSPRLQDALPLVVQGREFVLCSITASFKGWRGVLRLDLSREPPGIELFPSGLEYHFAQGPSLTMPDSSIWLARQGLAARNGNKLGGISDERAQLALFNPISGEYRYVNSGDEHNSQSVLVLPDRRHLVFFSPQHMQLANGRAGEAFLWDSWTGRVEKSWHAPGLGSVWSEAARPPTDSLGLRGLMKHQVVALQAGGDSLERLWNWPARWSQPRQSKGWLVCDENSGVSRIMSLDGRQRAIIEYQGPGVARLEPHGPSLDDMIVHILQPQQVVSFTLARLSIWKRWLESPATRLSAELAAFLLVLALSWLLFRQELLLRGILDDNSQPVALLDDQNQLIFVNREFRQLLDSTGQGQGLVDMLAGTPPGTGEVHLTGERWIRWLRRPVRRGRRFLGSVVFGVDETARRDADEGRRFRSLAGLITHELKTPMTPLRLGLDQLQREVEQAGKPLPENVGRVLGRMRAELNKMSQLIRQFMVMAGERRVRDRLDLVRVLRDAEERVGLDHMAEIRCERRLPALAVAIGDGEMLTMVLSGLLGNAVEAMERRGQLLVALVAQQDESGRRFWTLFIEDQGPGVSEQLRDKIWEPGFSTRPDGYGYGLYFARRVLQDMGGQIRLERSSSGGGLVRVDLPAADGENID